MSAEGENTPAIVVDRVSKVFRIPEERRHTLKERALHPFRRTRFNELEGLHDVSFAVEPGEFFGIVGRNGSGKSTLLKCMAGIYRVDEGQIFVSGRLGTFIELGVGFNPDLTAHDNVVLNSIMLGLTPSEARERFERVIEFSELQEFTDLKLKNYSSGMHVRLAFSVMINVDADVLLIDEVLAVGDAAFQQKCYDQFNRLRDAGRTILFVTHEMDAVTRFCHRALLLERGNMVQIGPPREVANRYLDLNFRRQMLGSDELPPVDAERENRAAWIAEAWFEDAHGERTDFFHQGDQCVCKVQIEVNRRMDNPSFALALESDEGYRVFATSSAWSEADTGVFEGGERVVMSVKFDNVFAAGRYWATPHVAFLHGEGAGIVDRRDRAASMIVTTSTRSEGGLVHIPHDLSIERVPAQQQVAK
jgi:ABC-type polysaccharide/polyol phosphate transport system ATPase subunit